jgi:hypothetical protein
VIGSRWAGVGPPGALRATRSRGNHPQCVAVGMQAAIVGIQDTRAKPRTLLTGEGKSTTLHRAFDCSCAECYCTGQESARVARQPMNAAR